MRRLPALAAALALLGGACGGDASTSESAPTSTAPSSTAPTSPAAGPVTSTTTQQGSVPAAPEAPAAPVALADVRARLTRVTELDQPLALALRAGDPTFYVAEKGGRVRAVRDGQADPAPVLDLSGEVSTGGEQGLLGLAFSPDGNLLYVSFTDRGGDSHVQEFAFRDGRADPASRREVLSQSQPFGNHNGGQVTFGPDGLLYVFFGDGGSGGDPANNAQNLGTWLGKVLRIDPAPSGGAAYTVPGDNPFVGRDGARPEIFSYGLRNPWRASFDRETGDLWIGDVGQNTTEEVNFSPRHAAKGANYGWSAYEGSRRFKPAVPAEGHVPPVHEYPTSDGCAVTGGYVYRGTALPALSGAYVFGDFCNGRVQALRLADGRVVEHRDLGLEADRLASFGEGPDGELYVLSLAGGLYRLDPA